MDEVAEVPCLSESMVLLASGHGLSPGRDPDVELHVAGAEFNMASGPAHVGHEVLPG